MAETRETLLSVRDVARRLNVSPVTVYRRVSEGSLPAFRIGEGRGPIRVSELELEEWLNREENP